MIGPDTNILVRYFAQDDPVQSHKATVVMEQHLTEQTPGFVSVVALAETTWVLERVYRLRKQEIAIVIERILGADALLVEHEAEVATALTAVWEGRGSFADALIAALNAKAGCSRTVTFDRKALRLPGFELL
ncbi:MAG: type II toxin-antitoxin system VapC family toxin [Candidatus Korobacteraceae bacterium]|jgi:predicted nucleic-acid-binding protein